MASIGRPTKNPRPHKVTARINQTSRDGLERFCKMENVKNTSNAIQELTLPLIKYERCPTEDLDRLEEVLNEIKRKGQIVSANYMENKNDLDRLKEALRPVLKVREEVTTFPPINIDELEPGTETKRVIFDVRSERLINETLKIQMEIIDNLYGEKSI